METEIKYPILQGGILPFWTPSFYDLENHEQEILSMDGMAEKSFIALKNEIKKPKITDGYCFFPYLGF